eukprot:TRINITY_DN2730_c0_g2_i1.p1 TRINITY_DN2730_c0_g2~~TRINITY_DN2730_c0_g2_i1.p1  ORF type:complete len:103 (+),score=11.21 TRINITY_DN2730_c0_g2_i1:117-425(+)
MKQWYQRRVRGVMSIKVPGGTTVICPLLEATFEECKPKCDKQFKSYWDCVERIGPDPPKGIDCQLQYNDYYRCQDSCVCCIGFCTIPYILRYPRLCSPNLRE